MDIRTLQEFLGDFYAGKLDGLDGPLTRAGVDLFLREHAPTVGWGGWTDARKRIAAFQTEFRRKGIESGVTDGYYGPQTKYAWGVYQHMLRTGGKKPEPWRDNVHASNDEIATKHNIWPRQSHVSQFYGPVGKNQGKLALPFPMKIAWNKKQIVNRITLHEKVIPSAERVFSRIASHYSPDEIKWHGFDMFGGSLNVRRMRGGSRWSMHSWGIAIDFDPSRNQFRWGRDKAYLAKPKCEQFWRFWEEEGWLSLGRARNFDWMHVQAARL